MCSWKNIVILAVQRSLRSTLSFLIPVKEAWHKWPDSDSSSRKDAPSGNCTNRKSL